MRDIEKSILLQSIDQLWREHLVTLDHLSKVVGWRGLAQRDPLNEYKQEAYELFNKLLADMREMVISQLSHVEIQMRQPELPPTPDLSHLSEIHVDPDLGETRVRRIVGAYGAGRIVNPKTSRSQCIGGMIGGIGMALMEHSVVDARNGRVPNANLAEYAVPVHADAPPVMDVTFVEEHDPHVNPLGVKGLGEIAIVGVASAVTSAVFHATGKRVRSLPMDRALLATA